MTIQKPYGFILSTENGSIKRYFNTDAKVEWKGEMTGLIKQIYIAQDALVFEQAVSYVQAAAKEHNLKIKVIYKSEWNKDSPVRKLFKRIFKK